MCVGVCVCVFGCVCVCVWGCVCVCECVCVEFVGKGRGAYFTIAEFKSNKNHVIQVKL